MRRSAVRHVMSPVRSATLTGGDTEYSSLRGFHKDRLDYPHLGKNEPEDPYLR